MMATLHGPPRQGTRRRSALLLAALCGGSALLSACERRQPDAAPAARSYPAATAAAPNLLLLTIDTLRADHVGAYGYDRATSPHIDALAAESVLFEQAAVQWPKTNPSMASMLSGTYCATNMVRHFSAPVDRKLIMLAEMLQGAGYYTTSFVANAHLGHFFNFDQGFDEVHEMWANRQYPHLANLRPAGVFPNAEITRQVEAWLDEHHDKRFFLWVHLLDPHGPYEPPGDLAARFRDDARFASQRRAVPPQLVPPYQQRPGAADYDLADFIARYDAEIVDSDRAVGAILRQLDALGLRDRSLVVLTSDHGESFGEHKDFYFDHGQYLYQTCLHVPLLLRWPGKLNAERIPAPIALVDLVPTVLDLLAVDAAPYLSQIQGVSWRPLLEQKPTQIRPVIAEGQSGQLAVRYGNWKLILDPGHDPQPGSTEISPQLFDLAADPGERHNVAAQHADVVAQLIAHLDAFRHDQLRFIGRFEPQEADPSLFPDAIRERLTQLGYLRDSAKSANETLPQ